ncbi:MAG: HEPN domain-containing protein [Propionibacterium freudenreichii]
MPESYLNLRSTEEWSGVWWLPDRPDKQVPGTLHYAPNGTLTLTLIGGFEDGLFDPEIEGRITSHDERTSWKAIWGAVRNQELTILDCISVASQRRLSSAPNTPERQTILATSALIGSHTHNENETVFSQCEISVENLNQWAASPAFTFSWELLSDGRSNGHGGIEVAPPEEPSVDIHHAKWTLAHVLTLPTIDYFRGSTVARTSETAIVRVTPDQPCTLNDALRFTRLLQDLVSLATHRAAGVIWLRLTIPAARSSEDNNFHILNRDVNVLYSPARVGIDNEKEVEPHRVFFTCQDLPFTTILPRWIELHERLLAASNIILGLRYAPAEYVENNLLTIVSAAEVLHRELKLGKQPIPNEAFKTMRDSMLDQIPNKHHPRPKGNIRNKSTLRERLHDIVNLLDPSVVAELIPDVKTWARNTAIARNSLAHEGKTPGKPPEELMAIVNSTTAILLFVVLDNLGLSTQKQRKVARDHPNFRAIAQQSQKWLSDPRG